MVSHLVFYQLVLIALVWVFLMLSWLWPSELAAARPIPPTPVTPPRKRSTAPKPFTGLIRQPHCDACAQAVASHREPPCAPSPRLILTRGRLRQVDTSRHFCPDPDCTCGGWLGLGNITSNGHPSGGSWRQLHCTSCDGYFQETVRHESSRYECRKTLGHAGAPRALGAKHCGPPRTVSSRLLKGDVRKRQVSKRRCLAKR